MSESTENIIKGEKLKSGDNVWLKSVRLSTNLLIHILMCLTVFISLFYAFTKSETVSNFDLHIILCVLGYQFVMCQGILVMSPYNGWSMYMKRGHKKHIHWFLQVIAAILVTAGTYYMMTLKSAHFRSKHGKLGCAALVLCLASLLNGILAMYAHKLVSSVGIFWIRFFHYITGLASLFVATASLCVAYEYSSFATWTGNADVFVPALIYVTWIFTILVSLDFWIVTGNKIRRMF